MPLWTEGFWARNGTRETSDRWEGRTGVPPSTCGDKKKPADPRKNLRAGIRSARDIYF